MEGIAEGVGCACEVVWWVGGGAGGRAAGLRMRYSREVRARARALCGGGECGQRTRCGVTAEANSGAAMLSVVRNGAARSFG